MQMSQKELELEIVKLEAEKDVAEAKERTEVAKLEAELPENEYLELMLNANSSSHHSHFPPGLPFANSSNTSSFDDPIYIRASLHDSCDEQASSHDFGCFRASVQVSSQEHPS